MKENTARDPLDEMWNGSYRSGGLITNPGAISIPLSNTEKQTITESEKGNYEKQLEGILTSIVSLRTRSKN